MEITILPRDLKLNQSRSLQFINILLPSTRLKLINWV